MRLPEHGANPRLLYDRLGMEAPGRLLDFSENCNPEGPPEKVKEMWPELISEIRAYPDPGGEPFLSEAAAFHGIDRDCLLAGNGAAELLSLLAERYRGKRVLVVHPAFSEYEATLVAKGAIVGRIVASEVDGFQLPVNEILDTLQEADAIYLCTPNNPTGILPEAEQLDKIISRAGEVGCDVVLDEAFIDFVDEGRSFIPKIGRNPHVTVVRSMTKMYAIPGIRLGYIAASPERIRDVKRLAPHWNVNGVASSIGAVCLGEEAYRERAILHAADMRTNLTAFLRDNGCTVTESAANFLSFKPGTGSVRDLQKHMLERGIVLRHSENFIGMDGEWLRVGMKAKSDMAIMKEELGGWFKGN